MGDDREPVEVLSGVHEGLQWSVRVSGTPDDLDSTLVLSRDGVQLSASGFAGPALYPGDVVNEWRGCTDDLPWFVMARTDPSVTAVTARTGSGMLVELPLSDPDPRCGVRHAAAGLPVGETPGALLVDVAGQPAHVIPQPVPRRRS